MPITRQTVFILGRDCLWGQRSRVVLGELTLSLLSVFGRLSLKRIAHLLVPVFAYGCIICRIRGVSRKTLPEKLAREFPVTDYNKGVTPVLSTYPQR